MSSNKIKQSTMVRVDPVNPLDPPYWLWFTKTGHCMIAWEGQFTPKYIVHRYTGRLFEVVVHLSMDEISDIIKTKPCLEEVKAKYALIRITADEQLAEPEFGKFDCITDRYFDGKYYRSDAMMMPPQLQPLEKEQRQEEVVKQPKLAV